MLYLRMVENYMTLSDLPGQEHTEGMIHVCPIPPKSLESPECTEETLQYDLVLINNQFDECLFKPFTMTGWQILRGQKAHWDSADWTITEVQPIENGDSCLLMLNRIDEKKQRLPISGEEETKD